MTESQCSDQMLINAFVDGNKKCIEALIKRYKNQVYSYILLNVKDRQVADDIFQDTFIKVVVSLRSRSYNDEGKFLPWVIRIAHNLVIDHFRRKKLNVTSKDEEEYDVLNSSKLSEDTIEDKIIDEQIYSDVRKLVEYLPEEQKEVILLRHYGDLSFKEIADMTNVSINTALGRMRYAVLNLRRMVEEKNIILTR